ncbi:hypothetical protein YC2023_076382 [Brassica napus]
MFREQDTIRLLFSEGMQCGFLSRYVFGVTHSFLLGLIYENKEFTCSRQSSAEQVAIDSGWKHVCFGSSAWDSVVVCFGFLGHMRGKQMALQGIMVAEVMICLSRDSCVESLLSKVVLSGGLCWQHQRFRVMFKKRCSFRLLQRNSQKFGVYRLLRLTRIESKIFWFEAMAIQSFKLASISAGNSGEGDVIPDSTNDWNHEPDHGELVAEDATRRIHCSRWKHYHLYTSTTIQDIPSSS